MSASEKLKALETPARPYWDEGSHAQEHIIAANRCVDALVDALPQIVALTEAAALAIEDILLMDGPEGDSPRNIAGNLRDALTALEEALS